LDEYFLSYYKAKENYAVGTLVFLLACIWYSPTRWIGFLTLVAAVITFIICTLDSISLRQEIKKLTTPDFDVAHAGVYTRLQTSEHGIGVFAIRDIPEGTNVFAGDTNEMRDIDESDFAHVPPEIEQLYKDFCVWKNGKIKGPSNFNNLPVGWYLNHSDTPNVRFEENSGDFISMRRIEKEEELTADYTTYDDRPMNFIPCVGSGQ
jgi:hypothetical protein